MKRLCERFWNETARIEKMVLLAGALSDESMPETLKDFFQTEDFEVIERALGPLPDWLKNDLECEDLSDVSGWLYDSGKFGYLIQIVTPVMTPTGPKSARYTWGHLTFTWVYGDTFNAAMKAGFAWVKEQRKKERREAQCN